MVVLLLSLLLGLCIGLGVILLRIAQVQRQATGLPGGRVIYADTGAWSRCEQPLLSNRYRLVGKPDYLVAQGGQMIPVEVKPQRTAPAPYASDIMQLAAYCLLVEDVLNQNPGYGILKYRDQAFAIDFTPALRQELLDTLARMRHDRGLRDVARSHDEPARCGGCGYRARCTQRLA